MVKNILDEPLDVQNSKRMTNPKCVYRRHANNAIIKIVSEAIKIAQFRSHCCQVQLVAKNVPVTSSDVNKRHLAQLQRCTLPLCSSVKISNRYVVITIRTYHNITPRGNTSQRGKTEIQSSKY